MQQIKITQSVTERTKTLDGYLKDIASIEMISPDEESELAMRIQQGDEEAYQRLVQANLRFVVSVAKQYQSSGLDLCDLINEGNIGLMQAAKRFDPTRGFKFISYAVWWIRQSIMLAIAEQGRMVRLPLNQIGMLNRINKTKSRFTMENQREPSDVELSELLDITPDKIGDTVRQSSKHLSFDVPFGEEGDGGTLLDVTPDANAEQADAGLQSESLRTDIQAAMTVLTAREREILTLAFGIGCQEMTLEEIGQRFDLTRERVRQIKEKSLRKLIRYGARERLKQYV